MKSIALSLIVALILVDEIFKVELGVLDVAQLVILVNEVAACQVSVRIFLVL